MTARWVFQGPGGLRAGWRVLLWGLIRTLLLLPVALVAFRRLGSGPTAPAALLPLHASAALIDLLVLLLLARLLDQTPRSRVGLPGPWRRAVRELAAGVLLGALLLALAAAPAALMGGVSFQRGTGSPGEWVATVTVLFFAAAEEELLARGYAFQWTAAGLSGAWATGIFSVLFAAAHLGNPGITPIGWAAVALAGVFLSLARLKSGGLWLPVGLHFGWNLAEGSLLGVPVSGIPMASLARLTFPGPPWLTGGPFGPEGSVGAVAAVLLGTIVLVTRANRGLESPAGAS